MPVLLSSEQKVLEHVAKTDGGIGYVSSEIVNDTVKVLSINK